MGSIPKDKWNSVIEELTRMLKPGGYLELMESNLSERLGPTSFIIANAVNTLFEQRGLETKIVSKLESYIEQQGQFEEIKDEIKLLSGSAEAGKLGQVFIEDVMRAYNNIEVVLLPILQVTPEEYKNYLKITKEEWLENNSSVRLIRVYVRKI
ncbi:10619_t:CDS:2 [Funneliformis caledonium]|uniref:10619_t:CDS:1 n=1 Tax=Funneliformis caledonium TaxID=1117310 RepID=A0A9N9DEB5_9GLOM|nr:10619_t:CDS:2 [Funneliformis caledonium]